jgi:class 3 adenylate cyclase
MAESNGSERNYAVAPLPWNEAERLRAVHDLGLLDTEPEERFDAVVRLAASFFDVPISYISLVDQDRQWFKSRVGVTASETPREPAFCAFTILGDEAFIVPDTRNDARFANNPLVVGEPNIGAYAGVPLSDMNHQKIGTLCLADHKARVFTQHDAEILWNLARLVERELHLGDMIRQQEEQLRVQALLLESQKEKERLFAELEVEKERAETFLLSLMPVEIAAELRQFGTVEPRYFHDVTVLFTDFVGFTAQTEKLAAEDLISLLNGYFSAFDSVIGKFGLEKLKTIGDSYMCVGGLPAETASHPVDAVLAAMQIQEMMHEMNRYSDGIRMDIRIGIHTGPVVAGVVGMRRFAFDIWGDTVNFSSRMESSGAPGRINISERTHARVKDFFACDPRGKVATKERREHDMYFVKGILPALNNNPEDGVPAAFQRRYRTYFRKDLKSFPIIRPVEPDENPLY